MYEKIKQYCEYLLFDDDDFVDDDNKNDDENYEDYIKYLKNLYPLIDNIGDDWKGQYIDLYDEFITSNHPRAEESTMLIRHIFGFRTEDVKQFLREVYEDLKD